MRRLLCLLILLAFPTALFAQLTATWHVTNSVGQPVQNAFTTIKPFIKFQGYNGGTISLDEIPGKTDTNGLVTYTNLIPGMSYQFTCATAYSTIKETNGFPPSLNNTNVSAENYSGLWVGNVFCYLSTNWNITPSTSLPVVQLTGVVSTANGGTGNTNGSAFPTLYVQCMGPGASAPGNAYNPIEIDPVNRYAILVLYSFDLTNWISSTSPVQYNYSNNFVGCRDDGFYDNRDKDGYWYVPGTYQGNNLSSPCPGIGLFRSKDLIHWEAYGVTNGDLSGLIPITIPGSTGGNQTIWSSDFIRDDSGFPVLYFSASAMLGTGGTVYYCTNVNHDGTMTNWSSPQPLNNSTPFNSFCNDPFVFRHHPNSAGVDTDWEYVSGVNGGSNILYVYTNSPSNFPSPFTFCQSNLTDFGIEATQVVKTDAGYKVFGSLANFNVSVAYPYGTYIGTPAMPTPLGPWLTTNLEYINGESAATNGPFIQPFLPFPQGTILTYTGQEAARVYMLLQSAQRLSATTGNAPANSFTNGAAFSKNISSGSGVVTVQNTAANGYSTTDFKDSSGNTVGGVGYGNSSAGPTFAGNVYLFGNSKPIVLTRSGSSPDFQIDSSGNVALNGSLYSATGTLPISGPVSITGGLLTASSGGTFSINSSGGSGALKVQNQNSGGYSTLDFLDNTGANKGGVGWGNNGTGGIFASKVYLFDNGGTIMLTTSGSTADFSIGSDGNVIVTNTLALGATNSGPANTTTVKAWEKVIVNGTTFYFPLYQ